MPNLDTKKKLIIFDWDDVFTLGSKAGYYACYHAALEDVGSQLPDDEVDKRIKEKWGSGHKPQLEWILRETPDLVPRAVEVYREHLFGDTFVDQLSLTPGSHEILEQLANDYILSIATGAHPIILKERVMPKFNIPDVFSEIMTIYDLDDVTHGKPHPYMAEEIMRRQSIQPHEAILVGDAANDMQMARNANVEPVAVLTGHLSREQAEKLEIQHILQDVTHLPSIL